MTDEANALVERLRWGEWYFEDPFDGKAYASDDPLDAANLIETQAREIERLKEVGAGAWVPAEQFVKLRNALEKATKFIGNTKHTKAGQKAYEAARAAMQVDPSPVAWMYERGSERKAYVERSQAALACGYAETPLYAHPPVADRVSTSSPVDDRAAPETSGKLRDAVEVYQQAYVTWVSNQHKDNAAAYTAAAAVIEADREAVRAEVVAEIVAWLRDSDEAFAMTGWEIADQIEAKFGGRGAS